MLNNFLCSLVTCSNQSRCMLEKVKKKLDSGYIQTLVTCMVRVVNNYWTKCIKMERQNKMPKNDASSSLNFDPMFH